MLFVLFVPQIFIAILLSFILESCKNRSIKLDITSAYTASESSFLSKSDSMYFCLSKASMYFCHICIDASFTVVCDTFNSQWHILLLLYICIAVAGLLWTQSTPIYHAFVDCILWPNCYQVFSLSRGASQWMNQVLDQVNGSACLTATFQKVLISWLCLSCPLWRALTQSGSLWTWLWQTALSPTEVILGTWVEQLRLNAD